MKDCRDFPLKVVVYGCVVDELLVAYESGARKFCDRDLPDGLKAGDQLQHRIIATQTIPHDDQPAQSLGYAATEHYLLSIFGSKKGKEVAVGMYHYGDVLHSHYEENAIERDEILERLELYFVIDEMNRVALAGIEPEEYAAVRTRPVARAESA